MADEIMEIVNNEVEECSGDVIEAAEEAGFTVKDGVLLGIGGVVVGFAVKGIVDTVKWAKKKIDGWKEKRAASGKKKSKKHDDAELDDDIVEFEPDDEIEDEIDE